MTVRLGYLVVMLLALAAAGCGESEPEEVKSVRPQDLGTPKGLQPIEPAGR